MIRLRRIATHCFSFEVFFAVFLYSGVFKNNPRLSWIPFDLTLLALGASLMSGIWYAFRHRIVLPKHVLVPGGLLLLFEAWAGISLIWSPSTHYGMHKAALMLGPGVWAFTGAAVVIGQSRRRAVRFLTTVVCLSLWMAVEVLLLFRCMS